jgi:transcriptional regulator of met regulon
MATITPPRPTGLDPDLAAALRRAVHRWESVADELPRLDPARRQQVLVEVATEAETLLAAILRAPTGPRADDDVQRLRTAVRRLRHVATAGELHVSLPCRVLTQTVATLRRQVHHVRHGGR